MHFKEEIDRLFGPQTPNLFLADSLMDKLVV